MQRGSDTLDQGITRLKDEEGPAKTCETSSTCKWGLTLQSTCAVSVSSRWEDQLCGIDPIADKESLSGSL